MARACWNKFCAFFCRSSLSFMPEKSTLESLLSVSEASGILNLVWDAWFSGMTGGSVYFREFVFYSSRRKLERGGAFLSATSGDLLEPSSFFLN